MLKGETPGGEGLGDEIDAADGEEPIQAAQHPFFRLHTGGPALA